MVTVRDATTTGQGHFKIIQNNLNAGPYILT